MAQHCASDPLAAKAAGRVYGTARRPHCGRMAGTSTMRLVALLGLAGFASALSTRLLDPLLVDIALEFASPVTAVALLASAFALPYALIQPLLGPVGDALGKRRVILWCTAALTATLFAGALAPTLFLLFAARALAGAAGGGIYPLSFALIGDNVPMAQRQVALSRFLMFGLFGQIGGGAMAAFLGPTIGWRGVTALCAAASLAALLVLWRAPMAPEPAARFDAGQALVRYRDILRSPVARTCYGGVLVEGCLVFGVLPFLAALLAARGLGGTQAAGFAIGAFGLGGLAYVLLAPLLVARLGPRRMFWVGGTGAGASLLLLAAADRAWMVVGATLLLGGFFLTMHNTIQARVTEVAPGARGSAVALHAFSFFIGQSLGPPLFAAGFSVAGVGPTLVAGAVGLAALGVVLSRLIGDVRTR